MSEINLPITYKQDGKNIKGTVPATLVDQKTEKSVLIKSLPFLPDFLQQKPVMQDASILLDALLKSKEDVEKELLQIKQQAIADGNETVDVDWTVMDEIYKAYCDTLYKLPGFNNLSYGAKISLIKENGFDYVLDLLLHMYDDEYQILKDKYETGEIDEIPEYEDFVQEKSNAKLTKLTILFSLINILKGKTAGLELVLNILGIASHSYFTWDIVANDKGSWKGTADTLPKIAGYYVEDEHKEIDYYAIKISEDFGDLSTDSIYYVKDLTSTLVSQNLYSESLTILDNYKVKFNDYHTGYYIYNDTYGTTRFERIDESNITHSTFDITGPYTTQEEAQEYIDEQVELGRDPQDFNINNVESVEKGDVYSVVSGVLNPLYMFNGISWCHIDHIESYKTPREPFTAELNVSITEVEEAGNSTLKMKLTQFVKYYMLPYIYVSINYTHTLPTVWCFPSGGAQLLRAMVFSNYVNPDGVKIHKNLSHEISEEGWRSCNSWDLDTITLGKPEYATKGFQGNFDLSKSYVLDKDGNIIKLFGEEKTIPDIIVGPARDRYTEWDTIDGYLGDNDYLQTQLLRGYIDIDILTGNQNNPTFIMDEDGNYSIIERDTLARFFTCLTVDSIHLKKTIEQMEKIHIEDFERELEGSEVYLGRVTYTRATTSSPTEIFRFARTIPYTREHVGIEGPYNLIFTDYYTDLQKTGIGDLGILGSNTYYMYNGMLLYNVDGYYKQIGGDTTWTDIGASHAVSDTYYTPAINDGALKCVKGETIFDVVRDMHHQDMYKEHVIEHDAKTVFDVDTMTCEELWSLKIYQFGYYVDTDYWDTIESGGDYNKPNWVAITGYINDYYTAFGICGESEVIYTNKANVDNNTIFYDRMGYVFVGSAYTVNNGEVYWNEEKDGQTIPRLMIYTPELNRRVTINGRLTTIYAYRYAKPNGYLYSIYINPYYEEGTDEDFLVFRQIGHSDGWTYITGSAYEDTYRAYGICDGKLYTLDRDGINEIKLDGEELTGWDSSFDCLSRYHHINNEYITYGICGGKLYCLSAKQEYGKWVDTIELLDEGNWTAICGFYNDASPRTFAYGIKNGKLYEIQGKTIIEKVNSETQNLYWTDINGCTTSTKTFVLGIAKENATDQTGYIYKINASKLEKLYENNEWVEVFGRYGESTSKTSNCYGYGIKKFNENPDGTINTKLYVLHKDGTYTPSGMWKLNGIGPNVDFNDYNFRDIKLVNILPPMEGRRNIVELIPQGSGDNITNPAYYDITVNYETIGFDNNTRYNVRAEITNTDWTYFSPEDEEQGRYMVDISHMEQPFNTTTGIYNEFVKCPMTIHGTRKINGRGEAYDFNPKPGDFGTYLEFPVLGNYSVEFDYAHKHYGPFVFDKTPDIVKFIEDGDYLTPTHYETTDWQNSIIRQLNRWETNPQRDIKFLETIRDEFKINLDITDTQEDVTEIKLQIGCICDTGLYPAILDTQDLGIYYGEDSGRYGVFVQSNSGLTQIISVVLDPVTQDMHVEPYLKFKKNGSYWDVYVSTDDVTYIKRFTSTSNNYIGEPRYVGGNGTIFGDIIAFLATGYSKGINTTKILFQSGDYTSVHTLRQDLVQKIKTGENQETAKVIEINTDNGHLLDFNMDKLYTSMVPTVLSDNLTVDTNYTVNNLHTESEEMYEGTSYATLTFSGAYTLDPEKAVATEAFRENSQYEKDSIGKNFSSNAYMLINPENISDPMVITTGSTVSNQYLFDSEEDSIITNKLLLRTEVTGSYEGNLSPKFVPSGNSFEMDTDVPGTVTRTLEYNTEHFYIDEAKIYDIGSDLRFDDYTAIMSGFGYVQFPEDEEPEEFDPTLYGSVSMTVKIDTQNGSVLTDGSIDTKPIMVITPSTNDNKIIAKIGEEYVDIGQHTGDIIDEETGDVTPIIDNTKYKVTPGTQVQMKLNLKKVCLPDGQGLNTTWLTKFENAESSYDKDKFQWIDGTVHNFKCKNYFETKNLSTADELVLNIKNDDDASKDQGIFGIDNVGSFCIKDNRYCWVTPQNVIIPSEIEAVDFQELFFIVIITNNMGKLFVTNDIEALDLGEEAWEEVFPGLQFNLTNNVRIGYAQAGSGMLPYNGTIDLTRSYIKVGDTVNRLHSFNLTTKVYIIDETEHLIKTIITPYLLYNYTFGLEYLGTLDLYASDLLQPYELYWLENRISINTAIKNRLTEAVSGYNPDTDDTIYTLEDYGIQLEGTPERWDRINVRYVTRDHAYYLQPNKKYYIKFNTEIDKEGGKCVVERNGNATWSNGVLSNFSDTDEYTVELEKDYVILHFKTRNITNLQGICGYTENNTKGIILENKKVKYFDDTNSFELFNVVTNKNYFIKLPFVKDYIEYSIDGEEWITTNIQATFDNYLPLTIGVSSTPSGKKAFTGSIDLKQSYIGAEETIWLYKPYMKVTPQISTDNIQYENLGVVPLLTTKDFITFGKGFNGTINLYESNLLLSDTMYWTGTQIDVHELEDDRIVASYIRDDLNVDTTKYWLDYNTVKVNPEDLYITIDGFPTIGNQVLLTYDTWYLFRKDNTEYEFKLTYDNTNCYISYNEVGGQEYLLYTCKKENHIVNVGYELIGDHLLYASTRGGMTLCAFLEWYTYEINYKKSTETEWTNWNEFTVESHLYVYERMGYELTGVHYLDSSYVKIDDFLTPFISYYNSNYIIPYGNVTITRDGIAANFSDLSWLQFKPKALEDGNRIYVFFTTLNNIYDQGVSTNLVINDEGLTTREDIHTRLHKARKNYNYVVQYVIEGDKVYLKVIGRNVTTYDLRHSPKHTLQVIPYNFNSTPNRPNYYITAAAQAARVKAYYRKVGFGDYFDEQTESGVVTWYPTQLKKFDKVDYMGTILTNVYGLSVPFGYEIDDSNANPDNVEYNWGDKIEFKLESDNMKSFFNIIPYTNITFKQKTTF